MNSLEIVEFKLTIQKYVRETDLPWEVKRLVFNEVLQEVNLRTQREVQEQANEREAQDAEGVQ